MGTKGIVQRQGLISAKGLTIQHLVRCESSFHRLVLVVVVIQAIYGSITTGQKYKRTSSMNCRERGSHARGVYPTQYTSRMGTARVKQEVGADKRNNNRGVRNLGERNVGTKGKSPKQGQISAKDLPIELPLRCETPYHRLD